MFQWADPVLLRDGRAVLIRPACRSDAELVQAFVRKLSAASRYERFFFALRELPPGLLERIVQPNEQHDVALLALATSHHSSMAVVGLAQYAISSDSKTADVAVVVSERWRRAGIATRMLRGLARFAFAKGLKWVQADILPENAAAFRLATKFDASVQRGLGRGNAVRVSRKLSSVQPNHSFVPHDWRSRRR
jgi:RimJ/RimL family protein N-acetyltransferase